MASLLENLRLGGAKEPTEIEKVEANLLQAENEMMQKLTQLGQMFFMENRENTELDPKYAALVGEIVKLDENRKSFYTHKLRVEGNMMCANCGQIIPYGSVYCSHCGKRADVKDENASEAQPVRICPKCGTKMADSNAKFCVECGTPVEE